MRLIQRIHTSALCLLLITAVAPAATAGDKERSSGQAAPLDKKTEERARYVIKIAGCNDCHTTGYAEAAGKIPEKDWLKGDAMGWRGPWVQPTRATYGSLYRISRKPSGSRFHGRLSFGHPCHGSSCAR